MNEVEYKDILNRERHIKDVKAHYENELKLLVDLVNYGTNLIPRAFVSSSRGLTEVIIIGVLLKQIVSMLDSIEIQISNANIHASKLSARALFEASIFIEWILADSSDDKAKHYYVSNLRGERKWALRARKGTDEHQSFEHVRDQLNVDPPSKRKDMEKEAESHIANIDRILSLDSFQSIDENFERLKNNNRRKIEPLWYKPFQVHSFRHMAKIINRHAEYDIFYSQGSDVTHSARYMDHIKFTKGKFVFRPIRFLEGISDQLFFSVSIVLRIYKLILEVYRPEEILNFSKKYINDWRENFINIKRVNYIYEGEERII